MPSISKELNELAVKFGLPDKAIDIDQLPWVPQGEGVWFKPFRFNVNTGQWINILKVTRGGKVNRHRHTGGSVMAYTIQGSWRYLERDWVAKAGTFVFEPPGDIHTLVVDEGEEMLTIFFLEGSMQYIDENGQITGQDDVFTKMQRYCDFCSANNIPIQNLIY